MRVSLSLSTGDCDNIQTNFKELPVITAAGLAAVMTGKRHWSPILWKDGVRRSENFMSCELAVFDFDDGMWTIAQAAAYFTALGYSFILGTTRSHGIAKGSQAPCDRFRVAAPFTRPIENLETYRHALRELLRPTPADKACTDGARKYRPCRAIAAHHLGTKIPWVAYVPPPPPDPEAFRRRLAHVRETGQLPSWIYRCLAGEVTEGDRNSTCFRLATNMSKYGVPDDEIVRMVVGSNITLSPSEKENAARSGIRAARR